MKNTGGSNSSAPPQKKLKQGTVLSFFEAAKVRNENARKRKLSEPLDADEITVLKVRCGDGNVEPAKGNDATKEIKPETKSEAIQENEQPKETKTVETKDEFQKSEESKESISEADGAIEAESKDEDKLKEMSDDSSSHKSENTSEADKSEAPSSPAKTESEDEEEENELPSANTSLLQAGLNSSLLMDVDDKSITSISDIPITPMKATPKARKLTPKQLERQLESQKRREAKEKEKEERELKKQQEKEMRQKMKEEKEAQKNLERLERQQKKQAEIDQKNEEKKAKEDEKRKQEEKKIEEKKKKEEEKIKEKQKREEERLLKKEKKEEERKKAEEEEKKKMEKSAAVFASFFKKVPTGSEPGKPQEEKENLLNNFMPFTLKKGMKLAPVVRFLLEEKDKDELDKAVENQSADGLYLQKLKNKEFVPKKCGKTFPASETVVDDDVVLIEKEDIEEEVEKVGQLLVTSNAPEINTKPPRAKLLQFAENRRPAYWGTWSKKSANITPKKPFAQDKMFDYEVDSDEEWEEEEPGESLHGSDDEKESEDEEYEVDNDIFVPHGYLSDEEGGNSGDEALPAEEQKERLKQMDIQFKEDMKKKVKHLLPRMVTCFYANDPDKKDDPVHSQVLHLLNQFAAVVVTDKIPTSYNTEKVECDNVDDEPSDELDDTLKTEGSTKSKKRNKMRVPDEAIPDFIRLLHGNTKNRHYLVKEFITYWDKKLHPEIDPEAEVTDGRVRISMGNANKKLRELAVWQACPDEGPFQGRMCWWVPMEEREKHNLSDLKLPNEWAYLLKPAARRSKTLKAVEKSSQEVKKVVAQVEEQVAPSPEPEVLDTPPRSIQGTLITKFTKVLTPEERQRQVEAEKQKAKEKKEAAAKKEAEKATATFSPSSAFFIKTAPTTSASTPSSSSANPPATKPSPVGEQKQGRRVSLLFSVPRGQAIPSSRPAPAFNPVPVVAAKKDDDDDVVPLN